MSSPYVAVTFQSLIIEGMGVNPLEAVDFEIRANATLLA